MASGAEAITIVAASKSFGVGPRPKLPCICYRSCYNLRACAPVPVWHACCCFPLSVCAVQEKKVVVGCSNRVCAAGACCLCVLCRRKGPWRGKAAAFVLLLPACLTCAAALLLSVFAVQEKSAVAEVKRRVRMSRDELEAELFKKFAEQPHWHFVQLQVRRAWVAAAAWYTVANASNSCGLSGIQLLSVKA